jgi:hypothetical protein
LFRTPCALGVGAFIVVTVGAAGCGLTAIGAGVALATSGGSSRSGFALPPPPPAVASISPTSASHAGGATLTIAGADFASDAVVTVGGVNATNVRVASSTEITATAPHFSRVGPVDIVVTNASSGGTSTLSNTFTYTAGLSSVTISSLPSSASGNIPITFAVTQPESDSVDLAVEVNVGQGFQAVPASELVGDLTQLSTSPAGVPHTLTYNSSVQFDDVILGNVQFRITPTSEVDGRKGTPGVSNAFQLNNNTPPVLKLIQPVLKLSFDIALSYTIASDPSSGVPVTSLQWHKLATNQTGNMTVRSGQGIGGAPSASGGALVTTVWDSFTDLGYGNDQLVTVTVSVSDGFSTVTATTDPFSVSNGPLTDQAEIASPVPPQGLAVGDVNGDGRPDVVWCSAKFPANAQGAILVSTNAGRTFGAANAFVPPNISIPSANQNDPDDPFLNTTPHTSECALLDVNGDGALDLVAANSYFAPYGFAPLLQNSQAVIGFVGADAGSNFGNVVAHQCLLVVPEQGGSLALSQATSANYVSTQASFNQIAPTFIIENAAGGGASSFPPIAPTGNNSLDQFGWFVQRVLAADLDPPPPAGDGHTDLVLLNGVAQVGEFLPPINSTSPGCVVVSQFDPTTGGMTPNVYLDPTDMGFFPTDCAVGDLLGAARSAVLTSLGVTPAPTAVVGSPDLVVANQGDSSLTFYFQTQNATFGPYVPPSFASLKFPTQALTTLDSSLNIQPGELSSVAIGDLNGDGFNDLVLVLNQSRLAIVLLFDTNPTDPRSLLPLGLPFRLSTEIPLPGPFEARATIADMNSDGRPDLLVASPQTAELHVFLNQGMAGGNPTFELLRFGALAGAFMPVVADIDGDTRNDVVVPGADSQAVSFYLQTTAGTLDGNSIPVVAGIGPFALAVGDVTGTGKLSLVCANTGDTSAWIYATDPTAGLLVVAKYDLTQPVTGVTASTAEFIALGDMNGDGKKDIAISLGFVTDTVGIHGGTAGLHGGWEWIQGSPLASKPATVYDSSGGPISVGIAIGDINKDGIPDVVLASPAAGQLDFYLGQGGGAFALAQTIAAPTELVPVGLSIVDLDGDGNNDVVVAEAHGDAIHVYYGTGAVGVVPTTPTSFALPVGFTPVDLVVADLNNDGLLDFLVTDSTSNGVAVGFQNALVPKTDPSRFIVQALPSVGLTPRGPAVGDLNGDDRNDIALPYNGSGTLAIYYQNPHATGPGNAFSPPVTYQCPSNPTSAAILDVNGDGRKDCVVSLVDANQLTVFFQR